MLINKVHRFMLFSECQKVLPNKPTKVNFAIRKMPSKFLSQTIYERQYSKTVFIDNFRKTFLKSEFSNNHAIFVIIYMFYYYLNVFTFPIPNILIISKIVYTSQFSNLERCHVYLSTSQSSDMSNRQQNMYIDYIVDELQ